MNCLSLWIFVFLSMLMSATRDLYSKTSLTMMKYSANAILLKHYIMH